MRACVCLLARVCRVRRVCSYSSNCGRVVLVLDLAHFDLLLCVKLNDEEGADAPLVRRIRYSAVRLFGACDRVVGCCLHPQHELAAAVRDGLHRGGRGDARLSIESEYGN